jgi:equilibrative nucleoside transporter 1/2/3
MFIPIHFLVFQLADLIGRALPAIPLLIIHNGQQLVKLGLLRTVFWPMFWACNVSNRGTWAPFFNDWGFFIVLASFGLSHGWLATCVMMEGGMRVSAAEREKANSLMSFCLTIGYALTSLSFNL